MDDMNYESDYMRVVPRDFFNEAKLLKCMGLLSLSIHDCKLPTECTIEIFEDNSNPFEIVLWQDGALSVINYLVKINDNPVRVRTTYNSKEPYPAHILWDNSEYKLFDNKGGWDAEFFELLKEMKDTAQLPTT